VDGTPMENGSRSYGPMNWESIPRQWVDRIEIVRGPGSARYGSALGGIVSCFSICRWDLN
jgi:outer membrane receptor for ferrienterochelin and colicin